MGQMRQLNVGPLPDEPLSAAAKFYATVLPLISAHSAADLVLIFPHADHTHRAWRLAAVQELARTHAPLRVNAVASDDAAALAAALAFLTGAGGITGQYLPLAAARVDSQRPDEVIG
jgi:hypothetical protein